MDAEDLKTACRRFEKGHGVEAFLDAMSVLRTERIAVMEHELRVIEGDAKSDLPHSFGRADELNTPRPDKWV